MSLPFNFDAFSSRACLAVEGVVFSYEDLLAEVSLAKGAMRDASVAGGEAVLLIGDYGMKTVGWLLALAELGSVVIPATEEVPAEEIIQRGEIAGARWKISREGNWVPMRFSSAEEPPLYVGLREQRHAGLVLFSSGSTGAPKAMVHDLTNLLAHFSGRRPKTLPVLLALLFDHIGGLNTLLGGLAAGQLLVCPASRDPEHVAELIEKYRVAVLPTSPTFLNLLLLSGAMERHDLSSLRVISHGTEPMPSALRERVRQAFSRAKLIETFGTSETGIAKTRSGEGNLLRLDDPNVESQVVDGELWLRSKTQILGYLNHDMARFTADGWFRTGDRVETGPDGALRVLGRENDWINVGGEKVFPAEVESVILELAQVAECRVSGADNPITGQTVQAEVVMREEGIPDEAALKREVRTHCRQRLERFKVPTRVSIVAALPISARGKRVRVVAKG